MPEHKRAVIALDLQNELVHPKGKFAGSGMPAEVERRQVLPRVARLLAASRAVGLPIAHVRVAFSPDYVDVHSRAKRFDAVRKNGALRIGTWGTEFHDQVAPADGEATFSKQSVNPFLTTGLTGWLMRRGIEEIVIFGVSTNQVVESTARHGDDLGLLVTVIEDCCASGNEEMHRFAVEKVFPIFAEVTSSESFLETL